MLNLNYDELKNIVAECYNFCQSSLACSFCPVRKDCGSDASGFANLVIAFVKEDINKKEKQCLE